MSSLDTERYKEVSYIHTYYIHTYIHKYIGGVTHHDCLVSTYVTNICEKKIVLAMWPKQDGKVKIAKASLQVTAENVTLYFFQDFL